MARSNRTHSVLGHQLTDAQLRRLFRAAGAPSRPDNYISGNEGMALVRAGVCEQHPVYAGGVMTDKTRAVITEARRLGL